MISFRWLSILCGIAIFIWSSTENTNLYIVIGLSMSATVLIVWFYSKPTGHLKNMLFHGAFIGFLTGIITAGLMLLKNIRHAHLSPDFPFEQIQATVERTPIWTIIGGLFGLSIGFLWLLKNKDD